MNQPATVRETATILARLLPAETLQADHKRTASGLAEEDRNPAAAVIGYRRHSDFKEMADAFEDVMRERGIAFTPINWSTPG